MDASAAQPVEARRESRTLSAEQIAAFESRGYLHLPEAFARADALRLQDRMWAELEQDFGIDRDDRSTWHQPMRSLRRAKWDPEQTAIATPRFVGAIDDLLGPVRWSIPSNWGVVLMTLPAQDRTQWALPTAGWHFDFELNRNAERLADLFVFTFFSTVELRGGGTLLVEGSHRLLRQFHAELSPAERLEPHHCVRMRFLRFDPWLQALTGARSRSRSSPEERLRDFMETPTEVRGVPVRVVELTGQPGDAILCHPLMLHAGAPNRRETPRFMRSQRLIGDVGT